MLLLLLLLLLLFYVVVIIVVVVLIVVVYTEKREKLGGRQREINTRPHVKKMIHLLRQDSTLEKLIMLLIGHNTLVKIISYVSCQPIYCTIEFFQINCCKNIGLTGHEFES